MSAALCLDRPPEVGEWIELHPVSTAGPRRLKLLRDPVDVAYVDSRRDVPARAFDGDIEVV
jgi:hypothetical protein